MKYYVLILLTILCNGTQTEYLNQELEKNNIKILFVGNSLTYYNDLPKLVSDYAKQYDIEIKSDIIAKPNYAIVDHLADGNVQKLIQKNSYDYVIIQQGPSSQKDGKEMLLEGGKIYSNLCKNNSSQLVYFMVWPSLAYYHTFDGVIENYMIAAQQNNAIICPVGKVWKDYITESNDFSFYSEDGFHPSKKGSRKAAEVIVKTLFDVE